MNDSPRDRQPQNRFRENKSVSAGKIYLLLIAGNIAVRDVDAFDVRN